MRIQPDLSPHDDDRMFEIAQDEYELQEGEDALVKALDQRAARK